MEEYLFLDMV